MKNYSKKKGLFIQIIIFIIFSSQVLYGCVNLNNQKSTFPVSDTQMGLQGNEMASPTNNPVNSTETLEKLPISTSAIDFLYNDETVKLRVDPSDPSSEITDINNIINLDDIKQSNYLNSDIEIIVNRGSQVFFVLNPINGALDYFPGTNKVNYEDCISKIDLYTNESRPEFLSGEPICILTNEKRIAIIWVTQNFSHNKEDDTYNVQIQITVFSNPVQ